MTNDATMDITRCAEVAAHLAHFPPANHAEVVARFGLRWRDWEAAAAYWAKVRDAELAAGKTQLSSRFVHAFVTTAERLKERQASMESIGPLPFSFRLEATPQAGPEPGDALASAPVVEATQVLAGARDLDAPSFRDSGAAPEQSAPLSAMPRSVARYLAETAAVSGPVAPMKLPFVQVPGTPDQALSRAMAHADAVQGPRSRQPASSGGTVAVSEPAAGLSPPPGVRDLTVEQYTSLRVELQLLPGHDTGILARYGVRPDDKEALFGYWRKRFEADPPLRMMFARGYAQYLAWFRENPAALEGVAQSVRGGRAR